MRPGETKIRTFVKCNERAKNGDLVLVRAISEEIGVIQGRKRTYLQDSSIKTSKKRNVSFVSKLTSLGAFVPAVYYNVQVAQSVTISNEDKKYDFYMS